MPEKFNNDTTLTRQGDNYQYIVAFECCINAKEGDVIYIEQRGDVATDSVSTEVKHHYDRVKISDNHTDFWKTLKNWVENYEVVESYKHLVLLTTSDIYTKSKLADWNSKSKEDKLGVLREITEREKGVPETINAFVKTIFSFESPHSEARLLEILEKFSISDGQPLLQDKINELLLHSIFKTIPKSNRRSFLNVLVSYIVALGRDNPEDWKVDVTEFNNFVSYNAKHYISETQPIPDLYKGIVVEMANYADYDFVKEMKEVELENQIPDAVNDYFRALSTVTYLMENDPYVPEKLSDYQDNVILTDIKLIKEEFSIDIDDESDENHRMKQSKRCFIESMRMPLKLVKGYQPNHEFFQRGTIHNLVNSKSNDFFMEI